MGTTKVLAMVMAGGEGARLAPLTAERSKPAVPFGGRYRIVDFVLSSLVNSGISSIYLLVQYKSQSLIEHVRKAWITTPFTHRHFVTVVPPQMRGGPEWFQGTSDAVFQNLNLVYQHRPRLVAVFGADHVYRMDVSQMVRFHEECEAEVTVAALPVPLKQGSAFGIIDAGADGRIRAFQEKPEKPAPMPGDPSRCYASMGNYLFSTPILVSALKRANELGEKDFGKHVLPRLLADHRVFAYDFASNEVPGVKPYEEPAYWRDVGTIEAYYEAHRDVLGLEPRFDVHDTEWPIHSSSYQGPVAKIIGGVIENCVIGAGGAINNATVRNSVIRREVFIDEGAHVEDSIVMDFSVVGRGARLRRVIVDRYNVIPPEVSIGYDLEADAQRFHVSPGGIVVLSKGHRGLETVY